MSLGNPKKAIAALMPGSIRTPEGLVVRPMTLAMYAALERIDSPMVTGREPKDSAELLPSLYLLCEGAEKIFAGNLVALAFEWADKLPLSTLQHVREACDRQMKTVMDVMPEAQKKTPWETTAGSRQPSTRRPSPTDGVTGKSSRKSRSPRSCS